MPTKRGLPTKGDHVVTPEQVLIGEVIKRDGGDLLIQRPGRKIVSKIKNFNHWKEAHGWVVK